MTANLMSPPTSAASANITGPNRGLKPTATIMMSLRDEEAMPMAAAELAKRMEKNLEGLGV